MASPAEGTRKLVNEPGLAAVHERRYKSIYESHPFCDPGEVGELCRAGATVARSFNTRGLLRDPLQLNTPAAPRFSRAAIQLRHRKVSLAALLVCTLPGSDSVSAAAADAAETKATKVKVSITLRQLRA